jgi:hypothetical protein
VKRPIPLRVGEILTASVKRHLGPRRVLITLKGHLLVAESERTVAPGDPITVQVLSIFPRIHLRHFFPEERDQMTRGDTFPLDLQT